VRSVFLDAVSPDDAAIARFIEGFESIRPQLLHGYVGAVDQLATWLLARHRQVPPPKAVWVTSAPLSEVQRERIERAFGAPVYDQYGCCEVYWLAAQCPARGPLHMFHDVRRIEFLGDDFKPVSDGELGRVAITDLENRLFPLIRYMNGDMARRVPRLCSCGVTLPLMSSVLGRVTDRFFLPGGDSLSGEYLTTLFDDCVELVQRFQVRQKADYSIDLLVVPATEERPAMLALERIRERLEHKVNRAVPVSLKLVSEIPSKGGKLQYVVSEVGSRHGGPTASIPGASAIG
jgi:phenylacetate-CoA ligase